MARPERNRQVSVDRTSRYPQSGVLNSYVAMVRDKFGLARLTMVGDRGMITSARIRELRDLPGMDWVTALR